MSAVNVQGSDARNRSRRLSAAAHESEKDDSEIEDLNSMHESFLCPPWSPSNKKLLELYELVHLCNVTVNGFCCPVEIKSWSVDDQQTAIGY